MHWPLDPQHLVWGLSVAVAARTTGSYTFSSKYRNIRLEQVQEDKVSCLLASVLLLAEFAYKLKLFGDSFKLVSVGKIQATTDKLFRKCFDASLI